MTDPESSDGATFFHDQTRGYLMGLFDPAGWWNADEEGNDGWQPNDSRPASSTDEDEEETA